MVTGSFPGVKGDRGRADREVRCTGDVRFWVITMSKILGVAKGVVWVSGWGVRSKDRTGVPLGIISQVIKTNQFML
jgi:hypothetical protein